MLLPFLALSLPLSLPSYISPGVPTEVAHAIQGRLERAYGELSSRLALRPTVKLHVLSEADWPRFSEQVFGMPSLDEATGSLFVAGEKSVFWGGFVELLQSTASPQMIARLKQAYGSGAEGDDIDLSRFFDLLVVHELGHAFHLAGGVAAFPRPWLQELYANLALHAALAAIEPDRLPTLLTFPAALVTSLPPELTPRRKLSEFGFPGPGENDVTPVNYVWYQARLHLAAQLTYDRSGTSCLEHLTHARFPAETSTDAGLAAFLKGGACDSVAQLIEGWDIQ